ncbi:MAG: gas vesicle protein [Planctomycetota bacterium]|nr:gas vesicle protein [Planctomycetota bacterium]
MSIALPVLLKQAREQLGQLTGLEVASTVSLHKEEAGWCLQAEVVEKRSLPDSQDILATYEVLLDDVGNVQNFARIGMRRRMDVVAAVGAESGS